MGGNGVRCRADLAGGSHHQLQLAYCCVLTLARVTLSQPPPHSSWLPSQAALESVWHVPCGGVPYGDDNCVFVANDWHTALLPVYLQVRAGCEGQVIVAWNGRDGVVNINWRTAPLPVYLQVWAGW